MDKLTDEQVKEFWERYGFKLNTQSRPMFWLYNAEDIPREKLPPICLDTLVKYAVPNRILEITFMYSSNCVSCDVEDLESNFFEGHINVESIEEAWKQSALALFWALWQVIGGKY